MALHSEKQLIDIDTILNQYGYPSERLIGNNMWISVILSHHNSISVPYNARDTLYYRSIELRNLLIDVEEATGMNLYLQKDWQKGKITVSN